MDGPSSERITTSEIIEAIQTALTNARAEGEPYKSTAEERLGAIEEILRRITLERHDVEIAVSEQEKRLEEIEEHCETIVHARADAIWEGLGRPDYDPIYNLLFPASAPKRGDFHKQAEHLIVVADLLSSGIHSKIDRAHASRIADELRTIAEKYHHLLYFLSKHHARQKALEAFEATTARVGLLELGALRKTLRSMGLDDTSVKSVVPPPVSSRRVPRS